MAGVGLDLPDVLDEPALAELLDLLRHHAAVADHGGQRRAQLVAHVGDELALGAIGALGRLARRFEPRLGDALLGDVGMHADPFAQRALVVDDRHRPDREGAVLAVVAPHPMLEDESPALRHRPVPGRHRGVEVVGMDAGAPAEALVFLAALARQRAPAFLHAVHAAVGAVGPQHALHGRDGGAEARLRAPAFAVLGVERAEQAGIVDRHRGLRCEARDEALLAVAEAPRLGMAEQQGAGDGGRARHHRDRHVAPHRQMAFRHAAERPVAGIVRHVVGADHSLVAEARPEQRGFPRQAEPREGGERRARQAGQPPALGLAGGGDHALEEGTVGRPREPRRRVDDGLGEGVEIEIGRQRHVELAELLHLVGDPLGRGGGGRASAGLVDVGHAGSCGTTR